MRISRIAALAFLAAGAAAASSSAAALEDGPAARKLRVAVYREFAPFSDEGQGIDVDVAKALAAKLGAAADIMTFREADDVDGDLRNVVWKGHYLRKEALADVMMHVPVDQTLIKKNDQVRIFAPYYRERIVVARNRNRIPNLPTFDAFAHGDDRIGVQFDTVEDNYLLSSFGGALREHVLHFASMAEAVAALRKGEVSAVMGRESFIEAALGREREGVAVAPIATPGLRVTGWDIGLAVKADNAALAAELEKAMAALRQDGAIERIFAARGLSYAAPVPPSN
jgi:ABC-type amino acid transport substrate-binding protein